MNWAFLFQGGTDYRIDWNDGRALDFWFGGMWIQDTTAFQNEKVNFQTKTFNYVGGFNYKANNTFFN